MVKLFFIKTDAIQANFNRAQFNPNGFQDSRSKYLGNGAGLQKFHIQFPQNDYTSSAFIWVLDQTYSSLCFYKKNVCFEPLFLKIVILFDENFICVSLIRILIISFNNIHLVGKLFLGEHYLLLPGCLFLNLLSLLVN